jgi:hypothetical protein
VQDVDRGACTSIAEISCTCRRRRTPTERKEERDVAYIWAYLSELVAHYSSQPAPFLDSARPALASQLARQPLHLASRSII